MRFAILVLIISIVHLKESVAQNLKGATSVSTSMSIYYYSSENTYKTWEFSINPAVAHYYSDRSAIGLGSFYNYNKSRFEFDSSSAKQTSHQFSFYPFWRHHFGITDKTGVFVRVETGFVYTRPNKYENIWELNVGGRSGLYHFLTERLSFELMWAYMQYEHRITQRSSGNTKGDSFILNLSTSSVSIGLQYYFLKEK